MLKSEECIRWARHELELRGYVLRGDLELVQDTPWSYVARFDSADGVVYLKRMPEKIALDAQVASILRDQFHAAVPEIITHSSELQCYLMKDAGQPLRQVLKQRFDVNLLCQAIKQFTAMQCAVAGHVDVFLSIGVPDWRLEQWPALYRQLLSDRDVLIADGLTEKEYDKLAVMQSKVTDLCEQLSSYDIKPSLVQPDFQDNNVLIDLQTKKLTNIDLGEVVISHPFFSLVGCLDQAVFYHGISEKDDTYLQLEVACLEHFKRVESDQKLREAFSIATVLWPIYSALSQLRLRFACDEQAFLQLQRHGKLSWRLKQFIMGSSLDLKN